MPVSAVPLPQPDEEPAAAAPSGPGPGSDEDGWALLDALRRRLDDQVGQGRKTQQQVTQLAESIAALVEAQRRRTRRLNLNSFVAYVIFTVLCGAGAFLLYQSRANELVEARDSARAERDAAVRRADAASAAAVAREAADGRAWEVYQLLEAGKRSEATAQLDALRDLPLSRTERAILAARAHATQVMEVDAALKAAAASFKAGRHAEVIGPLEAALVGEPAGARAAAMRYFLGVAYAKSGQLDKAVAHLQVAVASDVEHDDARFQLASALDRSGAHARARAEYDRFATAHPQSPLAVFARRRSATLARTAAQPAPAGAGAGAGAAAGAAAGAGAPTPGPAQPAPAPTPAAPRPAAPRPAAPRPAAPRPAVPAAPAAPAAPEAAPPAPPPPPPAVDLAP